MLATQTTPEDALEAASPALDPKMVLELIEDPAAAQAWFRVNAVKVARHLMQTIMHPTVPVAQKIQFMQACAKNGNLVPEKKENMVGAAGTALSLTIVTPSGHRLEEAVVSRPVLESTFQLEQDDV
jgi:hypothetical protein